MKTNRIFIFSLIFLFLAACGSKGGVYGATPTPTAEMSAGSAAVALLEQQMYINLTEQAVKAETIKQGAIMTATQQVMDATATESIRQERAQATQQAAHATQQVWNVTVEAARVQDMKTEQAVSDRATSTAEAQASATQMAIIGLTATVSAKETERSDHMTEQAPILAAQVKALEIETEKAQIALDNARAMQWFNTYGIPIIVFCLLLGTGYYIWRKSQVGIVQPDENGNYPLVNVRVHGGWRITKPSNMEGPVIELNKSGTTMPVLVDPAIQRQTTHGAQVVEAVKGLPPGYQHQALGMTASLTPSQPAVSIQVVQPNQIGAWVDEAETFLSEEG